MLVGLPVVVHEKLALVEVVDEAGVAVSETVGALVPPPPEDDVIDHE